MCHGDESLSSQAGVWDGGVYIWTGIADAVKRQQSVWVAAPSDEVHSTQELLEVRQGSQGLGRLGEVGRVEVFSHSRTELKHIQRKEGDCLVS